MSGPTGVSNKCILCKQAVDFLHDEDRDPSDLNELNPTGSRLITLVRMPYSKDMPRYPDFAHEACVAGYAQRCIRCSSNVWPKSQMRSREINTHTMPGRTSTHAIWHVSPGTKPTLSPVLYKYPNCPQEVPQPGKVPADLIKKETSKRSIELTEPRTKGSKGS